MNDYSASIVVRTLNEARYLGGLLEAIRDQDYDRSLVEVILVDSGSTDETLAIAQDHGCKIVHIGRDEFSFGRSLNMGCDQGKGAILVFISGHCVPVSSNWLSGLVAPFRDPNVSVTYGRQQGGEASKLSERAIFDKYFPDQVLSAQVPFFCNNANSAFRRESWSQYRFDEQLTGLEDMHLAKQLVGIGQQVVYVPASGVYHYHHEKWGQIKRRYEREAIALQAIMPEVHVGRRDVLRYFFAGVTTDFTRGLKEGVFWRKACEIIAFRFCQYYGAWCGNHIHRKLSHQQKERYFYPN